MRRRSLPAIGLILFFSLAVSAQLPARRARPAVISKPAVQSGTTYKGIFEPVNYGQDIDLTDVFFVGSDLGWVSGEHATILKTTDGGSHWTAQVGGDPNGPERPIGQLRFLDARHGWATTDDNRLLRTLDGQNWEQIGEAGFVDYAFTSVRHGLALKGNNWGFFVTNDGGRHWQHVADCQITVRIQGLPQTQTCYFLKLQMLSANSGLAFTSWRSPEAPNSTSLAIFRTDNGGQTWSYVVPAFHDGGDLDIFFTDLEHGVAVFNTRTYVTADGGRNWHALLSGGPDTNQSHVRFADPATGWSIGAKYPGLALSYTTDGGQHWKTFAPLRLPGDPDARLLRLSFPRRDRAYIAGPHGMIYRYRVVPTTYTAANSFEAPAMPGAFDAVLAVRTQRVRSDIAALQAKLAAAMAASGGPATSASTPSASSIATTASATTSAVPNASDASTPSAASTDASAENAASVDAAATGAIAPTPDANSGAASSQPDAASTSATDSTVASSPTDAVASPNSDSATDAIAGAVNTTSTPSIDNAAPSAPVAECCAAQVQALQNDVGGLTQQLPTFAGNFRSLNMIVAGLQIFSDLMTKAQTMRDTFRTLKHAPSLQAASAALMQLASNVQSTQQNITAELQNPGSVTLPASDVSAPAAAAQAFAQPTDAGASQLDATAQPDATAQSSTATPVPQSAPPTASTTASGDSSSSPGGDSVSQQIDNAAQKAKQKLKSKLKWPH